MISRMVPHVRRLSVKWSLKVGAKSDALARCFAITIAIAMSKSTGCGVRVPGTGTRAAPWGKVLKLTVVSGRTAVKKGRYDASVGSNGHRRQVGVGRERHAEGLTTPPSAFPTSSFCAEPSLESFFFFWLKRS